MRNWETKIELGKSEGRESFIPCVSCANDTKHKVLLSADYRGSATEMEFDWCETYQVLECLGCESLSFRKVTSNSEDVDQVGDNEWEVNEKVELFPPCIGNRKNLPNTHLLPVNVKRIYDEVKLALSSSQPVLGGIGIRALIETVCKEKNSVGANLENKIDNLSAKGFLTAEGAEILHGLRFLGNDAAHEGKPHSEKTLIVAFDVIENLLTNVYILPKVAAGELKRRPSAVPANP